MATGDITSVTIDSTTHYDGWTALVVIEGLGSLAAATTFSDFDFGTLPSSANFTMTVVSEGYNSSGTLGTITRTVYGTKVVRKPSPDNADPDVAAINAGADLQVRVALSEYVYNDDKNGGAGTSGTDPVVTIAAGWFDDGGGNTSNAATGLTVTNNSTMDYPSAIGQWDYDTTPFWDRVESNFQAGFRAYHGHGVACVILSATGVTSGLSVTSTQTAPKPHQSSRTSLYHESYTGPSWAISTWTQGEQIRLRARAYPKVGDADSIIDTENDTTQTNWIVGKSRVEVTCDRTGALKSYAVVRTAAAGGNDGTGVVSTTLATADASPYATIGAALAGGATVIYLTDDDTGTHDMLGVDPVTVTARDYFIEVRPHPDGVAANISVTRGGTKPYTATKLAYHDLAFTSSGHLDGEHGGRVLKFSNCTFADNASVTTGIGFRSDGVWYINAALGADASNKEYRSFSSNRVAYSFTGCSFAGSPVIDAWYTLVVCTINGATDPKITSKPLVNLAPTPNNAIFSHNAITDITVSGSRTFELGTIESLSNIVIVGNLIESVSGSQPSIWLFADGSPLTYNTDAQNFIVAHNTVVGNRCNLFYNDDGTTTAVRDRIFLRGNAFQSFNTKHDIFPTASGNRIGGWAFLYGVNCTDGAYDGTEGGSFVQEYDGIGTAYYDAQDGVFGTLDYTTDASADGTAAGNGDYTPTEGGNLDGTLDGPVLILYDQAGTQLVTDGTGAAGAIQRDLVNAPDGEGYGTAKSLLLNMFFQKRRRR